MESVDEGREGKEVKSEIEKQGKGINLTMTTSGDREIPTIMFFPRERPSLERKEKYHNKETKDSE